MPRQVVVNGRTIHLDKALPLQIKDWRALKKKGLTPKLLQEGADFDQLAVLLLYVLQKADPSVTEAEVDDLPAAGGALRDVFAAIRESEPDVDRPS